MVERARALLRADSIIVFPYNYLEKRFLPVPVVAGEFMHAEPENVTAAVGEGLKLQVLNTGTVYLKNDEQLSEFLREAARRPPESARGDFWQQEQIRAAAFVRFEADPKTVGESVGVMFINYRTERTFSPRAKELIEFFAQLVGYAIANDRLAEMAQDYWEMRRAASLTLTISELASSLAHNSGHSLNSLNVRFLNLDLYLRRAEGQRLDPKKLESLVHDMRAPLNELAEDFRRLKDYWRLDKLNMQPCDINELIRQSLHLLRGKFESRRITVDDKRLAAGLPEVMCDRNQIQHVLLNLFLNAAEAMPNKGRLSVGTRVMADRHPGQIQIRVSDMGAGIALEDYGKIFDPSFTTKSLPGGTGMGLPISKYIVERHGGSIEFTSRLGKGTDFFVYLPVGEVQASV